MGRITSAETVMKNAVKRTAATVKKKQFQRAPTFKAWTISKLLETYKDPRAVLLEICSTPTKALAAEMQCSMIEALQERRLSAQIVLPFVVQKLPVQIDTRLTRSIALNIVDEKRYEELVAVAASEDAETDGSFSMQLIGSAPVEHTTTAQPTGPDSDKIDPAKPHKDEPPTSLPPVSRFWNSLNRTTPIEPKPAEQGDKTGVSPSAAAAPSRAAEESWSRTDSGTWAPKRK